MMNSGSSSSATSVICQDRQNMAPTTISTVMTFPTMLDRRSVKALCAPMTSLLSRLTSAPVWVRVKNANGMRWTWRNTWDRMSKMSPSPTIADARRSSSETPASRRAIPVASSARSMTSRSSCPPMPRSMIARRISGLIAPSAASMTTRGKKRERILR